MKRNESDDLFALSVVAYALMIATISEKLGLSIEAGAIFSGFVLIKSPHVIEISSSISTLSRIFGGMYLTSLGMTISPTFVMEKSMSIFNLVIFIGMFKLTVVFFVLRRIFLLDEISSLSAGFSMAQISECSLIVIGKASRLGFLKRKTYLTLIPTTCILLALSSFPIVIL